MGDVQRILKRPWLFYKQKIAFVSPYREGNFDDATSTGKILENTRARLEFPRSVFSWGKWLQARYFSKKEREINETSENPPSRFSLFCPIISNYLLRKIWRSIRHHSPWISERIFDTKLQVSGSQHLIAKFRWIDSQVQYSLYSKLNVTFLLKAKCTAKHERDRCHYNVQGISTNNSPLVKH